MLSPNWVQRQMTVAAIANNRSMWPWSLYFSRTQRRYYNRRQYDSDSDSYQSRHRRRDRTAHVRKQPIVWSIIGSMTRIRTLMQVVAGSVVIVGFDGRGVLRTMSAVVQVAKLGTKVCIICWMRKEDNRMHCWMIPLTVTTAAVSRSTTRQETQVEESFIWWQQLYK